MPGKVPYSLIDLAQSSSFKMSLENKNRRSGGRALQERVMGYSRGSLGLRVSRMVRARAGGTSLERSSKEVAAMRATEP